MNGSVRPDILRQGISQPAMLGVSPSFMPSMPQSGQQQLSPSHLGLAPGPNPATPAMMLNNSPGSMNPAQQQRYHLMQQGGDLRQPRQLPVRQGQGGQPMMGPSGGPIPGGGSAPHMGGLGHNQGMTFNPNMMSQPSGNGQVRRVSSQPQMTQGPGPLTGMSPNAVNNNLNLGMNPSGNMQPQMRQVPPQLQHQLRMHNPQHMQNQMSPDMPMPMARPGGSSGMPPGRTGSAQTQAQLMNSLSQPSTLQHPIVHQNQFQNAVQMPSQHQQSQIPSPRPGSHTPNMSISTPGPSHTPVNRSQMSPDNGSMAFMNFPNQQFTPGHNTPRMPPTNGAFPPFVSSSSPSIPMADLPQPMQTGLGTPSGTGNRTNFHPTPAQQFEQMNSAPEGYPPHVVMPPPPHFPPRPPSHNNHHPPLPQQHQQLRQSPHPSDSHMIPHPPRPQSQPQAIPRPPSQQTHTPRTSHSQIPPGPPPPPGRMGLPHPGSQPGQQMPMPGPAQQHMTIAPRPPQMPSAPGPSNAVPQPQTPSDTPPSAAAPIPRPLNNPPLALGSGQGLIRLLQFSGVLASENKAQKLQLAWWSDLIKEHFTPKAIMKFTLWKDNQRTEAKPFEIGVPILPRFFLVTTQSGVKSMTFSLDGARERIYGPGHSIVECVGAIWTYKFNNGYTVVMRGPLTVRVVVTATAPPGGPQASPGFMLKFEDFQFDATSHDKYIALEAIMGTRSMMGSPKTPRVRNAPTPTQNGNSNQQQQLEEDKKWEEPRITIEGASIPGEPVNAFGIPQATMRCLELAESVGQMADLISFSNEASLGPIEALQKFAMKIRENMSFNLSQPSANNNNNATNSNNNAPPNPFASTQGHPGNVPPMPAVTLYSSAPSSITNPTSNPTPVSMANSPKNAPASASNSPQKQHKTIPQQQAQASSSIAPAVSPAVSSGATNTPALSNASLKRKQGGDTVSPTTATPEQPPNKRQNRKRRATGANAG